MVDRHHYVRQQESDLSNSCIFLITSHIQDNRRVPLAEDCSSPRKMLPELLKTLLCLKNRWKFAQILCSDDNCEAAFSLCGNCHFVSRGCRSLDDRQLARNKLRFPEIRSYKAHKQMQFHFPMCELRRVKASLGETRVGCQTWWANSHKILLVKLDRLLHTNEIVCVLVY